MEQYLKEKLEIPNPKWIENERMGRWNKNTPQTLKFYQDAGNRKIVVPRGYVRRLILFCRSNNIRYEIDDRRRTLAPVNMAFEGKLKPFQNQAVQAMLKKEFGTLCAPAGSGKTIMGLYMIAKRAQPALVVVHTRDLAYQWVDRIAEFLGEKKESIGLIGGGEKRIGDKISVALVQSLYKCAQEVSSRIGYLVVDECHRAPSRTFTEAVTAFDSRYMLGLSATPYRRDKLSRLIFWHLGDLHHQVRGKELVQAGHILQADVIFRETPFQPHFDPVNNYSKMLSELTLDDRRNHLIASDVAKEVENGDGVCLVLSDRKKHCEVLQSILKFRHHIDAQILTGDLTTVQRRKVLERLNDGSIKVLVATGQLVGEGFDCKNLSTLFIATPVRFSGRVIQYLGRVLRSAPGKKRARVYDYVDVNVGPLRAAAKAREHIYVSSRVD